MAIITATDINESLKKQISSWYDSTYSRITYMADITDNGYIAKTWIDPLDSRLLSIVSNTLLCDYYTYNSESLTTLSYRYYNTTSLWWLILMYNGFIHPHEIPSGYQLSIPKLSEIQTRIKRLTTEDGVRGKVVVV